MGNIMKFLNVRTATYITLLAGATIGLYSCSPTQEPFRTVQFCFTAANGSSQLRDELRQISNEEKMTFHDVSDQSYEQVKSSAPQLLHNIDRSNYIEIFVGKDDGMGLGAGNQGLGGNQVAVGFTAGANPGLAAQFSNRVLERLHKKWKIFDVSKGSAAQP